MQAAAMQIFRAAEWVDQFSIGCQRHGIDREITALEIIDKGDIGFGADFEAFVAGAGFALRAREGIFFMRLGMVKYRKITPHLLISQCAHLFGCGAHHDPVPVVYRQPEELIPHASTDLIYFQVLSSLRYVHLLRAARMTPEKIVMRPLVALTEIKG